jgi:replicative DNA helicase
VATSNEALLIAAVLRTGEYTPVMNKGISHSYFHLYKAEWKWIEKFIARYRKTPGKESFKAKFPDMPFKGVDDVEHFCEEVKRDHARYLFTDLVDRSLNLVEKDDIDGAVKQVHAGIIAIQSSLQGESNEFNLVNDFDLIYEEVKRRVDLVKVRGTAGVPSGFPTLDSWTGGLQESDYWIVGARLGQGKTWTLLRMLLECVVNGQDINYFSLEQNAKQIAFRIINLLSSRYGKKVFSSSDLRMGKGFNLLELKAFLQDLPSLGLGAVNIYDSTRGKITPLTISAKIEEHKGYTVNFVDYLQLGSKGRDWQQVAEMSSELASITNRYETTLIAAAQMNRQGDGREPPKTVNLGGSDGIGQDADGVIALAQQSPHVIKYRLAKYRDGEDQGTWFAHFNPGQGHFGEVNGNRAQEIIDSDKDED